MAICNNASHWLTAGSFHEYLADSRTAVKQATHIDSLLLNWLSFLQLV